MVRAKSSAGLPQQFPKNFLPALPAKRLIYPLGLHLKALNFDHVLSAPWSSTDRHLAIGDWIDADPKQEPDICWNKVSAAVTSVTPDVSRCMPSREVRGVTLLNTDAQAIAPS